MSIVIVFLVITVLFVMILIEPKGYTPPAAQTEQVSPYLTHYLAPNVHNNIQLDAPFEVVVPQEGLNEIIGEEDLLGWKWPVEFSGVVISRPITVFAPNTIRLMGKVGIIGFETVITICLNPAIDKDGMLILNLQYVRAGTLDISFLAKNAIKRVIEGQMSGVDEQYWLRDILAACLENKPFDPIFPVLSTSDNGYIRLVKTQISEKRLNLIFVPSNGPENADRLKDEKGLRGAE